MDLASGVSNWAQMLRACGLRLAVGRAHLNPMDSAAGAVVSMHGWVNLLSGDDVSPRSVSARGR
jgi:hypothetical protein